MSRSASGRPPIRVLVVDDSAFMRKTITRHLEADSSIVVVGSAFDGLDALVKVTTLKPDVVTLDVEMPRMDGLTALKRIMAECPTPVIMVSALTQRGARPTVQALMRGAVDFIAKPAAGSSFTKTARELSIKVKAAAGVRSTQLVQPADPEPASSSAKLRPQPFRKGDPLVVIGASTGGPRALQQVLGGLPADLPAAVAVVQHMPAAFTPMLAQRLNLLTPLVVQEAANGDRLARGLALLAPGDFHMRLDGFRKIGLDKGPPRNFVRPAIDVTMESAAKKHGPKVIGVVLTGMGSDGTEGARRIRAAGGKMIAEDASTCVVYGMPRSVAEAGQVDRVVPLPDVARTLLEMLG